MILILVDENLRQQSRARQPFGQRLRRLGRDRDLALAALARVLDALMLDDEHLGPFVLVLAGGLDADLLPRRAAFRTKSLRHGQFITPRLAAKVARRPTPAVRLALAAPSRTLFFRRRRRRRGQRLVGKEQTLIGIGRRRPWTVQTLHEGVELLLHGFAIVPLAPQGLQQFVDHLFEHDRVVGQSRGVQCLG